MDNIQPSYSSCFCEVFKSVANCYPSDIEDAVCIFENSSTSSLLNLFAVFPFPEGPYQCWVGTRLQPFIQVLVLVLSKSQLDWYDVKQYQPLILLHAWLVILATHHHLLGKDLR